MSDELRGLPFTKMTGSGNDFVCFDGRDVSLEVVTQPEMIRRICNRNNGIGSDGMVVLEPGTDGVDVVVHFFNQDGTAAELCGNATLCSTALSAKLGMAAAEGMRLRTGAGLIQSRLRRDGTTSGDGPQPEIDLQPVTEIRSAIGIALVGGEHRVGFAIVGIPHVVIVCDDAEQVDVAGRGPGLRWHTETGAKGANVNWVSPLPDGRWRYRTYERGVEGETLACGTGAVATAVLLRRWGLASASTVALVTSSGRELQVRLQPTADSDSLEGVLPSLQGEGRVVFHGVTVDL